MAKLKEIINREDDSVEIDGIIYRTLDDGTRTVEFPNGKIIRHNVDGTMEYEGKILYMCDKFTYISSNSVNEHGVILGLYGVDADIFLNGKKYAVPKGKFPTLDLFEKYLGKEFILDIDLRDGVISIYNGAIVNGFVRYSVSSLRMIIEDITPNKKRYYCTEYESSDYECNALVFEIEILD